MRFVEEIRWVRISKDAQTYLKNMKEHAIHRISVGKKDLCLSRYGEKVYAFENRCPHQLVPLTNASCTEDRKVVCPWHRFAFDLESGKGAGLYLEVFPTKNEDNHLYIGFKQTRFKLF